MMHYNKTKILVYFVTMTLKQSRILDAIFFSISPLYDTSSLLRTSIYKL